MANAPLILAIDDDEAVLQVYQDLLEDEGFRLSARVTPPTTIEEIQQIAPKLILLDLLFGSADAGSVFLRMLRAEPATSGLPVIVVTADQRLVEFRRPQLDTWRCRVILKPFDIDDLVGAIQATLGMRQDSVTGASSAATGNGLAPQRFPLEVPDRSNDA